MKQSVNFSAFVDAFHAYNRYNRFGYTALQILFDYLEELEQDTGEEIELDVISLCCDYSVDSVQDIAENYSIDLSDCEDEDERFDTVMEYLRDNTSVCGDFEGEGDHYIVYCSAF